MIANFDILKEKPIIIDPPVKKVRVHHSTTGHQSQAEDLDPVFQGVIEQYGFSIVDTEISSYTGLFLQDSMQAWGVERMKAATASTQDEDAYFASHDHEAGYFGPAIDNEELTQYNAQLFG